MFAPVFPHVLVQLGQIQVPAPPEILDAAYGILNFTLFTVGDQAITVVTILVVAVMLVASWWISFALQRGAERTLRRRGVTNAGTVAVTRLLLHYGIMAAGFAIVIQHVGIDLSALFAAGAIFAVGLRFAMQNITQNFVSGVILLLERTIKPGDIVEVEARSLKVLKMGIRTTVARTREDESILIPNSVLVQSAVKNFTLDDPLFRIRAGVGVSYDSDMRRVRETLERVAAEMKWGVDSPEPVILLTSFGNSSVDWEVSVWCDDAWRAHRLASNLREAIWWALKERGIVISYPQLDLHLDPPVHDALVRLPRPA